MGRTAEPVHRSADRDPSAAQRRRRMRRHWPAASGASAQDIAASRAVLCLVGPAAPRLHGHSAGAQFAARYLVTHPERLEEVVLSAPSAYPFPDAALPWPDGMARVVRDQQSGSRDDGKAPDRAAGTVFVPRPGAGSRPLARFPSVSSSARGTSSRGRLNLASRARPGSSGPSRGSAACGAMPRRAAERPASGSSKRTGWTMMRRPWPFLLRKYWPKNGTAEQIGMRNDGSWVRRGQNSLPSGSIRR